MKYIKFLSELSRKDVKIAGGKGANLGELTKAGFRVPNGFVIIASAYSKFYPELSAELEKELLAAFRKLGVGKVAVRSSALAEDSPTASFAGQHSSFLDVGGGELLDSVKKCWDSLYTQRAVAYRGKTKEKLSIAVVVQEMISADKAGVIFTINPVTQDKEQIIIEVVKGLGEKLVSGQVTPANYIVSKGLRILERKGALLSDKELLELAKLAIKVEEHYNYPQDIEFAIKKREVWLVQTRPVTGLHR